MSAEITKTEFVDINSIRSNEKNPRYIKDKEFQELVKSVTDFPEMLEARPCVVDEDGIILGGNMRHRAAVAAGLKQIPIVRMIGLSEEKKREFIIKDNVSKGSWDWDMLANEWDLSELNEFGFDAFKYNPVNLEDYFKEATENETETDKVKITLILTKDESKKIIEATKKYDKTIEGGILKMIDSI